MLVLAFACGGEDDRDPREPTAAPTVADALTRGLRFVAGTVQLGDIASSSNGTVTLSPPSGTVMLAPGRPSLLPLEIESSDESDAVEAVLLQFEDAEDHIEVDEERDLSATPTEVSLDFDVDDAVCDGLCARVFQITMVQAVRLTDDSVSARVETMVELDCRAAGDPSLCP
jgi:hypothetical protein